MKRPIRALVCIMVSIAMHMSRAPETEAQTATPRLRVAVMDLTGTALKMQTAQTPTAGGGVTSQTTIAIPPPAEFARSLTEALTTSLAATGKFIEGIVAVFPLRIKHCAGIRQGVSRPVMIANDKVNA